MLNNEKTIGQRLNADLHRQRDIYSLSIPVSNRELFSFIIYCLQEDFCNSSNSKKYCRRGIISDKVQKIIQGYREMQKKYILISIKGYMDNFERSQKKPRKFHTDDTSYYIYYTMDGILEVLLLCFIQNIYEMI